MPLLSRLRSSFPLRSSPSFVATLSRLRCELIYPDRFSDLKDLRLSLLTTVDEPNESAPTRRRRQGRTCDNNG